MKTNKNKEVNNNKNTHEYKDQQEHKDKHEFAFFLENLSEIIKPLVINYNKNTEIKITNQDLMHRLLHIVRLELGEIFVIFDQKKHARLEFVDFEKKKSLTCKIIEININKILEPTINILVPILKRENFEFAIYSAVELGASEIITLTTEKSQKTFNHDRSTKILISAAEQSKNFAFSNLNGPIELTKYIETNTKENAINIFFDAEGEELHEVIKKVNYSKIKDKLNENINFVVNLMIGPEGDLTEMEKSLLKQNNFIFCKLTPTILRSFQAVNVGLGAFRALLI